MLFICNVSESYDKIAWEAPGTFHLIICWGSITKQSTLNNHIEGMYVKAKIEKVTRSQVSNFWLVTGDILAVNE